MRSLLAPGSRHVILRFRQNAVKRSVALDTFPKVLELCFPGVHFEEHKQDLYFIGPNKSEIWMAGLDEKERVEQILGLEFATIFFNECSQIPWGSILTARTRLAQNVLINFTPGKDKRSQSGYKKHQGTFLPQRFYYDLNPTGTGHWSYILFQEKKSPDTGRPLANPEQYEYMYLNPKDNVHNLTPEYMEELDSLPERQRKRFYEGLYTAEIEGALWSNEILDNCRLDASERPPAMQRIVVGIDPSGTSGDEDTRSDEVGITVGGLGTDGRAYLLEDATCRLGPAGWGDRAIQAFIDHRADAIVAEANYGGDMVRFVVQSAAKARGLTVKVKKITASRGKVVRAEPISALYEQGKVKHNGRFMQLEDQMLNMSTAGYQGHKSPDRLDAWVWTCSELMLKQRPEWLDMPNVGRGRSAIPIFAR